MNNRKNNMKNYINFIKQIEILNIYLKKGKIELKNENIIIPQTFLRTKENLSYVIVDEEKFKTYHDYYIKFVNKKTRKIDVSIECSFVVVYTSKIKINDEIFKTFSKINVPLNTWPYIREFVQNALQRLNLPPLTLPARKTWGKG